jgi:hypothetical protein
MANIKELIQSIESTDSSFDEKLEAINKMEETLVAMRQQEETAIQDNVDLIVEAIKVMENKVTAQLEVAKSIVPEKGDKGDKGNKGADGRQGIDGKNGQNGVDGKDGIDGKDGVSVSNAQIDFDGSLVITLSTGQEINVGEVVAPELQERIKLVTSGGAGTVLPTQTGNANKYLKTDGSALSWDALNGSDIDLSTPPTIGNTTPSTGTFTTLIGGGSSANYGQLTGGATTKAVEFQTLGSDSNIALVLDSKGTGAIDLAAGSSGVNISNGGTVTAITRTNSGGANYTTVPSVTVSAPTTAGGVQATASAIMFVGSATVSAGGSGYAVGNVLTIVGGTNSSVATLTVATLSGSAVATVTITTVGSYTALPSNPVSVTGGAGTGATFTLAWSVNAIVVDTAGSGYVEQPTVTFSSGSATAYATVGSGSIVRGLGTTTSFYTPSGELLRLNDLLQSTPAYTQLEGTSTALNYRAQGAQAGIGFNFVSKGTIANAFAFSTGSSIGTYQFVVAHTTSAVNYVQVTGATTASKVVAISAQGSDTDVTLSLAPKGAGTIRFGTHTAGVLTPTGYITITDSGGTSRRLLVG